MEQLAESAFKAIGSVFARGMLSVFVKSLLMTFIVLVGFIILATSAASMLAGHVQDPAVAAWLPWLTGLGSFIIAWFLFPGIMPVIVNFFDNTIASIIEQKDYPASQPLNPPFWPEMWHDVRFSITAILLNILLLPLYFTGIGFIAFFLLNGHLLGKEFFVMVARRHVPLEQAISFRKNHSRIVFIGGLLLTFMATIPLINLLAPFWGIALMTHLYHSLKGTPKVDVLLPNTL